MNTFSNDPVRRLAELAADVAAHPQRAVDAACQVRAPRFLKELRGCADYPTLAASLAGQVAPAVPQVLGTPVGRALIALTLARPDWDLALDVLNQTWLDAQLMPLPIAVGESVRGKAPDANRDDQFFFFNALGTCYHRTPWGSCSENQERAIECYEKAKQACSRDQCPSDWSIVHHNLGLACEERISGHWAENCRKAEKHLVEEALTALDDARRQGAVGQAQFLARRGRIYNSLGNLHRDRPRRPGESGGERFEQAIGFYEKSKADRQGRPADLAETLNNLGTAYLYRFGEPRENRDRATASFRAALEADRDARDPLPTAMTLMNLGLALSNRAKLEPHDSTQRRDGLGEARQRLAEAERLLASTGYRREQIILHHNRGLVEIEAENLPEAYRHLQLAVRRVEEQLEHNATETARRSWLRLHAAVYEDIIACAVMLDGKDAGLSRLAGPASPDDFAAAAACLAESSRARGLAERMAARHCTFASGVPTGQILDAIPESARWFRQLADDLGAGLLTLRATHYGTCAVLIPPGGLAVSVMLDVKLDDIAGWLQAWHLTYHEIRQLLMDPYRSLLSGEIQMARWRGVIGRVLTEMGATLGRALSDWLEKVWPRRSGEEGPRPIVVLPGQGFNVLPLHGMSWCEADRTVWWDDRYEVTYAPSFRVLESCRRKRHPETDPLDRLLAVSNPTGDLGLFGVLADTVAGWAKERLVLGDAQAGRFPPATFRRLMGKLPDETTPGAPAELERWSTVLLATHGYFDPGNPLAFDPEDPRKGCSIHLADAGPREGPPRLALRHMLDLVLRDLQLIVLCACETAIPEPGDPTGEQMAMPAAWLAAGAAAAMGTLWEVEQGPSMLLVWKFFRCLTGKDGPALSSPASALREAQRWLRRASRGELNDVLAVLLPKKTEIPKEQGDPPYAHPFYWSAFVLYGAP